MEKESPASLRIVGEHFKQFYCS